MMKVPLSSPDIIEKDIEAVVEVMKTRFLSIGPKVVEFVKRMSALRSRLEEVNPNFGKAYENMYKIVEGL